MEEMLLKHKARGVTSIAFGDISLADWRTYREDKLALIGLLGVFPL